MKRRALIVFAVLAVSGLVGATAATGRHGSSSSKSSHSDVGVRTAAPGIATGSAAAPPAAGAPGANIDFTRAKRPADVIHTAKVAIEARDAGAAARRAIDIVRRAGGDVFSSSAHDGSEYVVFKVPPAQFDAVMDALRGVGKITQSQTSTEDVTGRVVDLDARLAAARTSAQRLRDLLAHSGNVTDLLQVEQSLSARESEVESLDAQRSALAAQIDDATITVDIRATAAPPAVNHATHIPGFLAGLRAGARADLNTALVIATGFGFALPFLPIALAAFAIYAVTRRRRRAVASTV